MNFKALREKILTLAIQGKLVPQRVDDGTVDIDVKDVVPENEQPFEIPENWRWVRLFSQTGKMQYGYTALAKVSGGDAKFLRITDITPTGVDWAMVPFCEIESKDIQKFLLKSNDILIARTGGTIGKSFWVKTISEHAVFASYLIRMRVQSKELYVPFLFYYLGSPWYWEQLKEKSRGTGQPNVNAKSLADLLLPLPPLTEQKRIVVKVEELMTLIDQAEAANVEINALATQLKSAILTKAIQGKLVPQRLADETVDIDVKDAVPEDEQPFEIPQNWRWVKAGVAFKLISGRDLGKADILSDGGEIPYLTGASQIQNGNVLITRWTNQGAVFSERNDLLLTCKGTVGKTAINLYGRMHIARQIMALRVNEQCITTRYLALPVKASVNILRANAQGLIPGIDRKMVLSLPIPLPPRAEQTRIVAKVEELFSIIDNMAS